MALGAEKAFTHPNSAQFNLGWKKSEVNIIVLGGGQEKIELRILK